MNLHDRSAFILSLFLSGEAYGREVLTRAKDKDGTTLSEGTLYPLLRSMEADGLLSVRTSEPMAERGGRRRYYYRITGLGQKALYDYQQQQFARVARLTGVSFA